MKKYLNKTTSSAVVAVISILSLIVYISVSDKQKVGAKNGIGQAIKQDLLQRVTIAGTVTPFKKAIIMAPYRGYVKKLFVKMGDHVKQGDPLVSVSQSLQSGDSVFPLRAPFSGKVVQIDKTEGEYVSEGNSKEFILRIDDTSKLYVLANAPEIDRVKVQTEQEAIIKASAILSRKYKGIIRELSFAAREKDQWSRSQVVEFPIKIEIMDADESIKPGMSVVIDVITAKKENVIMLRHEFVRREGDKYYVLLASGKRQDIQVGLQNEEGFEIVSGVTEQDRIRQVDFSELGDQQ